MNFKFTYSKSTFHTTNSAWTALATYIGPWLVVQPRMLLIRLPDCTASHLRYTVGKVFNEAYATVMRTVQED
jgi:hypothetical protein